MWILSNVVLNSIPELERVIESGVIANITIACRDNVRTVRREAIFMLANMLTKLCDEKMLQQIRTLTLQYQIEAILLDCLRNDWRIPENQQIALFAFNELFKLPAINPETTITEGKHYRDNFSKWGGPEVLE